MNKKLLAIILIIVVPIIGFFIYWSFSHRDRGDKFITANPLDLSQIESISMYRSCIGHDYSGYNTDGELEEDRSMKHYVTALSQYSETTDKVKVYAPFDGFLSKVDEEESDRGNQVWLDSSETNGYYFIFFHIGLLDDLKLGSQVESGQHIGYANLEDGVNFDIGMKKYESPDEDGRINTYDSPFYHMSSSVLREYSAKGITLDNIIKSKSDRDKIKCNFGIGSGESEWVSLE